MSVMFPVLHFAFAAQPVSGGGWRHLCRKSGGQASLLACYTPAQDSYAAGPGERRFGDWSLTLFTAISG
jgi:hypothetical protein